MCPLYPLHIIFSWSLLLALVWICGGESVASAMGRNVSMKVRFLLEKNDSISKSIDLTEGEEKGIIFYIDDLPPEAIGEIVLKEESEDGLTHVDISPDSFPLRYDSAHDISESRNVTVSGIFLGFSKIKLKLSSGDNEKELMERDEQEIKVKVLRETKTLDTIFISVVITLITIAYINMGCAVNLDVIKSNIKKPVSPAIGLASQYIFMPLISYGLGYALFSSRPELWLGLFITGCSPGGGGSNLWTYILGGSLDLSITMTFLSTIVAFATVPLWTWALGPSIFADGYYYKFPYAKIFYLILGLVVPCAIGLGIRRCSPKAADFLKKTLKPLSLVFLLFIMTFGVYAKLYLFSFFTWQVALAGFCLPFFGYAFGGLLAMLLKREWEDVIAISIETGIQNTGLSVGVIEIALSSFSPLEDIAIVLPVAVATMTPIPLLICYITKYFRSKMAPQKILSGDNCADYQTSDLMGGSKAHSNGYLP